MKLRMALARLAGARPDLLEKAPGDLARHATMGGVLLSTAAVAGVSAFFALSSVLGLPWPVCVAVGAGWAAVILNLDRMLIVSMSGLRTTGLKIGAAVPRLVLAVVIGTVISTPLVLRIFQPEINAQLVVMQAEGVRASEQTLDQAYARIKQLTDQRNTLEAAIAGGNSPSVTNDPDVQAATKAYQAAEATYEQLNQQAQCELDGTCGTGHAGQGDAYRSKAAAAQNALQARDQARQHLNDVTAAATKPVQGADQTQAAQARQQLPAVQRQLAAQENARQDAENAALQAQKGDTGLLARLEALERVTNGHPMAWWAHTMLFLLFVCVEVLPVVTKILAGLGAPTLYDQLARSEDEDVAELDRLRARTNHDIAAKAERARVEVAEHQLAGQAEAGRKAAEALVEKQAEITAKAIEVWAGVAQQSADRQLDDWMRKYDGRGYVDPPTAPIPLNNHHVRGHAR